MNMKYKKKITFHELINFAKSLETLANNIDEIKNETIKETANELKETIASTYVLNEDEETPNFSVEEISEGARVSVKGSQVVYHEYGTGSMGSRNPHPNKPANLNPYNAGKTIRPNRSKNSRATLEGIPVRGLYWTYEKNGIIKYTQGVASGKEVYYATKEVRKNMKKILSEKVGEELSKL